ncbi:SUPPRESSOR OF GAMMA RESPONSE 1 [Cajanus cajan]|uniref:SUPPRESSOR OF GAMMA RESPONSE 1 n=1 Tax=Cajanus cajan TaxID=3821 RepID=UPI00098D9ECE|nr:SUPPRESSOR OF GAMMA RESPONSE 1 [Cajanus cajan]
MARSWLIDIGGFAKKVKNTTVSTTDQIKDFGTYRKCPKCHYHNDNNDVSHVWPGFPVGVKFVPSDVQLLEHLAAKCCIGNRKPHIFIHDFIPTLEGDQGICYTHPENLPGAKKDGNSVHFFHKTVNAYATGQRKRRKIHDERGLNEENVRWHKTGRTKAVIEDGVHKGFKKIMVLYVRSKKGSKPYKTNWVMHQYHLGSEEDEKDGEYVVSKVFYQQHKKNEENPVVEDSKIAAQTGPRTPIPNPPTRPCTGKSDDNFDENELLPFIQDAKPIPGGSHTPPSDVQDEDNKQDPACLAGEPQADSDFDGLDDILLCKEMLGSSALFTDSELTSTIKGDSIKFVAPGNNNDHASYGISILDTLELDSPPDFDLSNLQFGSQDSTLQWIDKL